MSNIASKMPTSYREAERMLDGREHKVIAHNTFLTVEGPDVVGEPVIGLVYHSTTIVRFFKSGMAILRTGGWQTATTKDRLNGVLRWSAYRVFQKDFLWYVSQTTYGEGAEMIRREFDWEEGIAVDLNLD